MADYGSVLVQSSPTSVMNTPWSVRRRPKDQTPRRLRCVVAPVAALCVVLLFVTKTRQYDVIVVGGGPAGSAVSAKLAKKRVLVLEAGGGYRQDTSDVWARFGATPAGDAVDVPRLWTAVTQTPRLHWDIPHALVAKLMGGCGAHNAMLYVRATRGDVDRWGVWSWRRVLGAYDDVRLATRVSPELGSDELADRFLQAANASGVAVGDLDDRTLDVAGPYLFNIDAAGRRASAYRTLLEPLLHKVSVQTGAAVSRVLFRDATATGVEYVQNGKTYQARARAVVLTAGALNTPRILHASGLDNPGIGNNLQDHPVVALRLLLTAPPPVLHGSRFLSSPGLSVGAFLRSDAALVDPDIQLTLFAAGQAEPHVTNATVQSQALLTIALLTPDARHAVELNAKPAIHKCNGSWVTDFDAQRLLAGVAAATRLVDVEPLRSFAIFDPDSLPTEDDPIGWVHAHALTNSHWCGTAKAGHGPDAVVDANFRVASTNNLFVADASVIPTIPNGNTHSTVIALATMAADAVFSHLAA